MAFTPFPLPLPDIQWWLGISIKLKCSVVLIKMSSSKTIGIVVAKYKEPVDWLYKIKKECPHYHVYLYDKSIDDEVSMVDEETFKVDGRENVGREAESYLCHIVQNYDRLQDYVFFLQGNPFDHVRMERDAFIQAVAHDPLMFRDPNRHPWVVIDCDGFGMPNHPGLPIAPKFGELGLGKVPPDVFHFVMGAQFLVSRGEIHKRSKAFYRDLLQRMHGENKNLCPWTMERLWGYILNLDDLIKNTTISMALPPQKPPPQKTERLDSLIRIPTNYQQAGSLQSVNRAFW